MNRRLFLGGFAGVTAQASRKPLRLNHSDGRVEYVDPAAQQATALIFLSTVCPVSNAYQGRIQDLISRYTGKPVRVLLINANANESAADTADYSREVNFSVPFYKDWSNIVADRFSVSLTPESVLLDRAGAVRYQGAIDDAPNPARVKTTALRDAIDAVIVGQAVPAKAIRAFGCTIKRVQRT